MAYFIIGIVVEHIHHSGALGHTTAHQDVPHRHRVPARGVAGQGCVCKLFGPVGGAWGCGVVAFECRIGYQVSGVNKGAHEEQEQASEKGQHSNFFNCNNFLFFYIR